ncbi:glycoside hydrolase family 32 protein [Cesiribacter sp. SM1]|uniref:glycoside hydrolase family 32 protein n=1 Tax=Cesiribacter sp. SM1 TaxID=2861196 RepID=UPI001CD2194E|nr:glycoside hydrolase family 32 protein [Cesiribacter sp. SM1]
MKIKQLLYAVPMVLFMGCQAESSKQTTDEVVDNGTTKEAHRLLYHFTPPSGWMNDPNGMVYHDGEYHLFYQHNPDSTVWGPMHWGHAVSKDMVQWEHLPIALYPDSLGTIFSGSAVVDLNNTSGLGTADNPPMVAIYTYHNAEGERAGRNDYQTQGIAFSLDRGRSWTKYESNPVLPNPGIRDFRDPKVSWNEEAQKWIMALAVADHISFYSSKNLKEWQHESDFGQGIGAHGGVWECPDLFKMQVNGSGAEKWVLLVSINPGGPNGGSATQYFVGDFDGKRFVLDEQFSADVDEKGIWIDYGRDNYAGVTWSNIPAEDGRRLFMGWMSNWKYANVVPTEKWRSAMTVARTLTLAETSEGLRLLSNPVEELEKLYQNEYTLESQAVASALDISEKMPFRSPALQIDLELELANADGEFAVELSNDQDQKILVGYDAAKNQYFIDRTKAGTHKFSDEFAGIHYGPRLASGAVHTMKLLVDVASVELFADGGKTVMTDIFFPDEEFTNVRLVSQKGNVRINAGKVTDLKSIYNGSL